jgi:hypothetical protein
MNIESAQARAKISACLTKNYKKLTRPDKKLIYEFMRGLYKHGKCNIKDDGLRFNSKKGGI